MLRYGFFNSVDGDRTYDAEDMSRLFEGIIYDGIFYSARDKFAVVAPSDAEHHGLYVAVKPGRAWFDGIWVDNDDTIYFTVDQNTGQSTRYDYVALVVDKRSSHRDVSVKLLRGSPDYGDGDRHVHTLARIAVQSGAQVIQSTDILSYIGTDDCPWVVSPIRTLDIEDMVPNWEQMMSDAIDAAISDYFSGLVVATKPEDIGIGYGICSTAANTSSKTAVITDFIPTPGGIFAVKFVYDVPANSTLNINNGSAATGAKPLYFRGSAIGSSAIKAGETVTFVYDSSVPCYRIIGNDGFYRKPATGIPYTDLDATLLAQIAMGTSAYQKPSGGIPETDLDSSVQTKLNSGGSGQGATFVHIDLINGDYMTDTSSAAIYAALQLGDVNYVAIDPNGRECILVSPPDNASTGHAVFATLNTQGTEVIVYTFIEGNDFGVARTHVPIPTWNSIKPSGGIPASDLASDAKPFIISLSVNNNVWSSDKTVSQINTAIQNGQAIVVKTANSLLGWVSDYDSSYITMYTYSSEDHPPIFNEYHLASNGTVTVTTFEPSSAPQTVTVSGSTPTIAALDNTIYSCGELTSLTITDSAQNISFTVDFTSGTTPTAIFVPSGYKAPGGDLTPEANKTYELNVRNGRAVLTAFEAVSA